MDGSTIDHGERAHATLSASSAHRWMACPGSVALCATGEAADDTPSEFAAEGTRAHELAEAALRADRSATSVVADPDTPFDDIEMGLHVNDYVNAVWLPSKRGGAALYIEQRIDYSAYAPGGFGTADALVVSPCGTELHVFDLKYGMGVRVDAQDNPQLMAYGLGALDTLGFLHPDIRVVHLTIVQPRLDHITSMEIEAEGLRTWGEDVLAPAAQAALAPDAPRVAGKSQCRWCDAKGVCPTLAAAATAEAIEGFEPIPDQPGPLTAEQVADALRRVKLTRIWADAIEDRASLLLARGEDVPGYKMVAGRTMRRWADEDDTFALLKKSRFRIDEVAPRKIVSPAGAEKLFGKGNLPKSLDAMIVAPSGKPVLAPESDKRPALDMNPIEGFEPSAENTTTEDRKD